MSIAIGGNPYISPAIKIDSIKNPRCIAELPHQLPTEPFKDVLAEMDMKYQQHMRNSDYDNASHNAVKQITVNGQLVATIYKKGVATITSEFSNLLKDLNLPTHGSDLATIRAEMIAKAVGGEIKDISGEVKNAAESQTYTSSNSRFSSFSSSSPRFSIRA